MWVGSGGVNSRVAVDEVVCGFLDRLRSESEHERCRIELGKEVSVGVVGPVLPVEDGDSIVVIVRV
jgi:hypothetical protein